LAACRCAVVAQAARRNTNHNSLVVGSDGVSAEASPGIVPVTDDTASPARGGRDPIRPGGRIAAPEAHMEQRRRILVHAFIFLTVGFALGLVAGPLGAQRHPHARLWLSSHIVGILVGIMTIGLGLARPHLRLGPVASQLYFWSAVGGNWVVRPAPPRGAAGRGVMLTRTQPVAAPARG